MLEKSNNKIQNFNKYIKLSRVIVTFMAFIILNIWFLFENDPQWILSIIISGAVLIVSFPSSKICKFLITQGDKIKSKILKVVYYIFILPITFLSLLLIVGLFCALIVALLGNIISIDLETAVLIAFIGIVVFTCCLVPYFQTLIILILRWILKSNDDLK